MDRYLRRRQTEDQIPAVADMRQLENVAQERVIGVRVCACDDNMRAVDHDVPNLCAALARARAASASRSRGSALVCSESSSLWAAPATSSIARLKAASLACEGL